MASRSAVALCLMVSIPRSASKNIPSERRERFLTSAELARIGSALREAETTGIPWVVDEIKPNAKHIPKQEQNRRTIFGPFVTAAVRLLLFTGCRLREILDLKWEYIDTERGLLLLLFIRVMRPPDSTRFRLRRISTRRLARRSARLS